MSGRKSYVRTRLQNKMIHNVDLGDQHERWQRCKDGEGITNDSEFARLLLNLYENSIEESGSEMDRSIIAEDTQTLDEDKDGSDYKPGAVDEQLGMEIGNEDDTNPCETNNSQNMSDVTVLRGQSAKTGLYSGNVSEQQADRGPVHEQSDSNDSENESEGSDFSGTVPAVNNTLALEEESSGSNPHCEEADTPSCTRVLPEHTGSSSQTINGVTFNSESGIIERGGEKIHWEDGKTGPQDISVKQLLPDHLSLKGLSMMPLGSIICMVCGHWNAGKLLPMKRHLFNQHGVMPKDGINRCEICSEIFITKYSFEKHMNDEHKELPYKCEDCGEMIKWHELKRHKYIKHKKQSESNYVCDTCGITYTSRHALMGHLQKHKGVKFPCPYKDCDKIFATRPGVSNHVGCHHKKIKTSICSICGKQFARREHLDVHMRQHSGAHPFSCHLCDYTAKQKVCVRLHMVSKHQGCNINEQI